jgi:hypothetical protein
MSDERFYKVLIPEMFKSLNSKEQDYNIEVLSLPDIIPMDILKFLYNTQETKELIELGLYEGQINKGISNSPILATAEFHEKKIIEKLNPHHIKQALKHYIFLMESRAVFTQARISLQNISVVPENQLERMTSNVINQSELSNIEKNIIQSFNDWGYNLKVNEKEIKNWASQLQYDKLAVKTFDELSSRLISYNSGPQLNLGWTSANKDVNKIPNAEKKKLEQFKEFFEERKLYHHASSANNLLGNTNNCLDDKIKFYNLFNQHFRKDYALNTIFDILMMSKYIGNDQVCSNWIEFYANNQKDMDGILTNTGYRKEWIIGQNEHYDYEFNMWYKREIIANPLIKRVLFNIRHYKALSEEKKISLSEEIINKSEFDKEQYTQYIQDYFQNMKDSDWGKVEINETKEFLGKIGLELTPSLELK